MSITLKSDKEIDLMRQAGLIVAKVLKRLKSEVRPGITTQELDNIAVAEVTRLGGIPSFKGYRGYPASICVSLNEEIVHGIPDQRKVKNGDLVSIDFGAIYRGFHGDSAITVGVGKLGARVEELMDTTERALKAGIEASVVGARMGDVSFAIQKLVEAKGFAVIREYTGHGIGREMHEDPQIPNFGTPGQGPVLKRGMTFALEPMVCMGDWRTKVASNNWTVSTIDGSWAAHFEHSVAVTDKGPRVLTTL
jgi:methionyl aminopeptidase